ncbi:MAG: AAA family ATPase [Aureispira sp.]
MAREKHLTAVHIGNFKRFVDFKVENLGQFNLVVGDNNTGKTSFLEALVVDDKGAKWISSLSTCITQRQSVDVVESSFLHLEEDFQLLLNDYNIRSDISLELKTSTRSIVHSLRPFDLERDVEKLRGIARERILLLSNPKGFTVSHNDVIEVVVGHAEVAEATKENDFIPFIPFGLGYDQYLENYFAQNIDNNISTRQKFIERLTLFIPKIQDVRLGQKVINIFEEGRDHPNPLYTYGEGSTKFFRILCEIAMSEGKRLMIDEIDAGIHHTKFVQFWKAIMQAATEFDVQIFATTHNEECLKYFQAALELEELEEQCPLARVISLKVRKEQKIRAKVYDFASLQIAEDLGHEIRGGGL